MRSLYYALIVATLLATASFIYLRAESPTNAESLTKIIYAGPIPALVILGVYGRLLQRTWQRFPLTLIPDAIVFLLALLRFLGHFSFSGHALFLSYLVITAGRSRLTLAGSLLFLIETIFLKLFVFQDSHSLPLGMLLMIPFALIYRVITLRQVNPATDEPTPNP